MSRFVVIHPFEGSFDQEAAVPVAKAIKANCSADAYWIRSVLVEDQGKLYCDWDAKDADAIRATMEAAAKSVPMLPIEGIYPVTAVVHGEDYR